MTDTDTTISHETDEARSARALDDAPDPIDGPTSLDEHDSYELVDGDIVWPHPSRRTI